MIAVKPLTFSRLKQPRPLHLPLCIMSSTSLSIWRNPNGLLPVCWYHSSTWGPKNGQGITDVATLVSRRWENKCTSLDLCCTPANAAEHAASLHSPNSCSYLLSNWILRSFAAEDPASQSFGCKYAGSSALKGGSAFLCAERLKIFVDSFVLEVRTPPSSSLALLLSSAPLSLMSSENVPRLHSFLSSKPIYRTI